MRQLFFQRWNLWLRSRPSRSFDTRILCFDLACADNLRGYGTKYWCPRQGQDSWRRTRQRKEGNTSWLLPELHLDTLQRGLGYVTWTRREEKSRTALLPFLRSKCVLELHRFAFLSFFYFLLPLLPLLFLSYYFDPFVIEQGITTKLKLLSLSQFGAGKNDCRSSSCPSSEK